MSAIIKKTKLNPDESKKIRLTMAKLNLEWWIKKGKNSADKDYSTQIQFARFKLERESGQKVKLRK